MHIQRLLLLLAALTFALPVFSQTDTAFVKVDSAVANPDSKKPKTRVVKDTVVVPAVKGSAKSEHKVVKDSARLALEALPGKAAWSSAIVPGWGQIRNGRWWKVPFIYGGLVSIGLAFDFNQRYYKEFLEELQYRVGDKPEGAPDRKNPKYLQYDNEALISAKNFYRRNRDLSILGFFGVHAINIIDAYVDAKFFRYDISDKLGFRVQPSLIPTTYANATPVPAIKLTISL